MNAIGLNSLVAMGVGTLIGIVSTHRLYGDYPMLGLQLEIPPDLEGDPRDGEPVFRIKTRSEICKHVQKHKHQDVSPKSKDEYLANIKVWADDLDEENEKKTAEVWAKIETYGFGETLAHRMGLKSLEDIRYDTNAGYKAINGEVDESKPTEESEEKTIGKENSLETVCEYESRIVEGSETKTISSEDASEYKLDSINLENEKETISNQHETEVITIELSNIETNELSETVIKSSPNS